MIFGCMPDIRATRPGLTSTKEQMAKKKKLKIGASLIKWSLGFILFLDNYLIHQMPFHNQVGSKNWGQPKNKNSNEYGLKRNTEEKKMCAILLLNYIHGSLLKIERLNAHVCV